MPLLVLLLLLLFPALTQAQCPGMTTTQTPFATETLTIGATATGLTSSVYKPSGITPTMGLLTIEGGAIRYQVSGTPTASTGHPLAGTPPQTFPICGIDSLAAFRAIRSTTTNATLTATYYRSKIP
jgi:hypothetical protein